MKVTVCFGAVRVLVPCGAGHLLVRDLVREATFRYNKATGQDRETWMGVRAIRASSGGILDPDDRVCDVADDRETLTAECTSSTPQPRAAQADGASGSSAGTASPDMFRGGSGVGGSMRVPNTDSCVEVSAAELEDGSSGLQVRRGSEPTLNQDTLPQLHQISEQTNKRWSAAVVCREDTRIMQKIPPLAEDRPPDPPPQHGSHNFQRHSNRLSMQFSGPGSGAWMDAADRVQSYGSKSLPRDARRDPLGQDTNNMHNNHRVEDMLRWVSGVNNVANVPQERPLQLLHEVNPDQGFEVPIGSNKHHSAVQTIPVTLVKGEKGLGFTITTRDNPTGGDCPIYIKNILPKGAAVADGRLRAGDRLVSVCGTAVAGRGQQHVVSLLRATPTNAQVTLVVERSLRVDPQQSPSQYAEKEIGSPEDVVMSHEPSKTVVENGRVSSIVNAINSHNDTGHEHQNGSPSRHKLPNKQFSPENGFRDKLNSSSSSILSSKNRTILHLDIPVHDSEKAGLGISVKGKATEGDPPHELGIFIKSVLHGGAASRDGRLHTNDQLLSVNGVSLMGLSNAEAMEKLRRGLLHARPQSPRNIALTIARRTASMDSIARWKDDTPPNGNDTTTSNENSNSQNYTSNTVIYNSNCEDNKMSIHIDNNYNYAQPDDLRNSKRHASIVTINTNNNNSNSNSNSNHKNNSISNNNNSNSKNNNNSWASNQSDDSKGFLEPNKEASKRDSFEWSRLDGWNPVIDRLTGLRNESYYMATQVDGTVANGHGREARHMHVQRSPPAHHNVIIEEDYVPASSGGGGVESGSESGSNAFSRDAVGRRSMSEKRHAAVDARSTGTYHRIKMMKANQQVGPSLGMRKSSSLESLQTAIQENKRNPHKEPTYARVHPPLKHWLTDEQPDSIVRGSPQQSSLSHKKPSLLKSLSTMFSRKGKPQKKPENEIYGRSQPGRSSEKSLSRDMAERQSRHEDPHAHRQHPGLRSSGHHTRQSSSDRSAKSDERINTPPYRAPPIAAPTKVLDSAWGPSGHYVNYDEIQHNLNIRREKLSEVQIGQMRQQVHAQRAKVEEESRRGAAVGYHSQRSCREAPARPQSNYYEYDSAPPRRPGKLSHYH